MKKLKLSQKSQFYDSSFKHEYERALTKHEESILKKQLVETQSTIPKKIGFTIFLFLLIISFHFILFTLTKLWLIIPLSIVCSLTFLYLFFEVSDLIILPKLIKKEEQIINKANVNVQEINIDRYIKIINSNSKENQFIIEYKKILALIGGPEFFSLKKMKTKIQVSKVLNSKKTILYYNKVKTSGANLNSYYTFKNGVSEKLMKSEIWFNLNNFITVKGKLEDFNNFIKEDKIHSY